MFLVPTDRTFPGLFQLDQNVSGLKTFYTCITVFVHCTMYFLCNKSFSCKIILHEHYMAVSALSVTRISASFCPHFYLLLWIQSCVTCLINWLTQSKVRNQILHNSKKTKWYILSLSKYWTNTLKCGLSFLGPYLYLISQYFLFLLKNAVSRPKFWPSLCVFCCILRKCRTAPF